MTIDRPDVGVQYDSNFKEFITEPGDGRPEGLELEPAEPEARTEPLEREPDGTGTVGTRF